MPPVVNAEEADEALLGDDVQYAGDGGAMVRLASVETYCHEFSDVER